METDMNISKITGETCLTARPLWEEVFSEDSKEFTDYYFTYKAKENIGYVIGEEPYEAMLFRTPYKLQLWGRQQILSYIVGVATRPECRHKGYMTALLMTAFQEMYREKQPFTFLMPANPAIYEPFDFRYVYERPVWKFLDDRFPIEVLETLIGTMQEYVSKKPAKAISESKAAARDFYDKYKIKSLQGICDFSKNQEVFEKLAHFANQQLAKHYDIFVHRDADYYKRQLAELKAQNGDIFLAFDEAGTLQGFFLYAKEDDEISIQELIEEKPGVFPFLIEEAEKKPIIMARIIHAEEMLKLARSKTPKTILLELEDDLIPENDGLYRWELTPCGSTVTKLKDYRDPELRMDISELTKKLVTNLFINEIV